MSEKSNTRLNLVLTIINVIATTVSAGAALNANALVQQQNTQLLEAATPNTTVREVFRWLPEDLATSTPCENEYGSGEWIGEYAGLYDVSNTGGRAIALSQILADDVIRVAPSQNLVDVQIELDAFRSRDEFDQWQVKQGLRLYEQQIISQRLALSSFDFSSLPMDIDAGETKRIPIHIIEKVYISRDVTAQQVFDSSRENRSENWVIPIAFAFADKSIQYQFFPIFRPYQWFPIPLGYETNIGSLETCASRLPTPDPDSVG